MENTQVSANAPGDSRRLISIEGALSGDAATQLRSTVAELLDAGQAHLIADLSGVTDIDLEGLEALSWAADQTRQQGEFLIRGAPEQIASLLRIVRLDRRVRLVSLTPPQTRARER